MRRTRQFTMLAHALFVQRKGDWGLGVLYQQAGMSLYVSFSKDTGSAHAHCRAAPVPANPPDGCVAIIDILWVQLESASVARLLRVA